MIIAVDFDGTCVTHEFPNVGENIGAERVLKMLIDKGHHIILYTMRSNREQTGDTGDTQIHDVAGTFLDDAIEWFQKHEIPLYAIQQNPTQHKWTQSPKCYAEMYIDDAALGCPLVHGEHRKPYANWDDIYMLLVAKGIL